MHTTNLECRFSAVQQLQSIRDRYQPGSYYFRKADYAIKLALRPGRTANAFLVPNTLRDAGKILQRKAKHRPPMLELDAPVAIDADDGSSPLTLHDFLPSQNGTPADLCAAKDFLLNLETKLGPESSAARQALHAMLHGDTASDFAERTGFSQSYFKKLKVLIRLEANRLN